MKNSYTLGLIQLLLSEQFMRISLHVQVTLDG